MAAAGALAVRDAQRLLDAAVVAVALSLEAFKGSTVPFDARLHELRRQPGPADVAERLRALLAQSPVVASHADCGRVQDPYTLRCAPQVLGAVADALGYVAAAIERELDAVTDNPLVFPPDDILSGGNFHGQPLSLPLDHLALALCELASFSERRIYALLSPGYAGLPPFLTPRPGLSSGLMIAQYAAAALVNECQVLSHPAGAGSIPTSAGQEDFNSMGALAALKARTVVENAAHVVATELVCAAQGLEFHRPLRSTAALERAARARARVRAARGGGPIAGGGAGRAGRRAADRGAGAVRCRGWVQEAALRMLENNLHPDVAERPEDLVVYGGIGKAARNPAALEAIKRELMRLERPRDAARAVRQAGRRLRDAPGRAARADRQLQPRRRLGELGDVPRARRRRADDVRPDDRRVLDLHRDPGDPPGHLRDVRGARPPALRRLASRAGSW